MSEHEELRRLAELASQTWRSKTTRRWVRDQNAFRTAANPATILSLLDEIDRLQQGIGILQDNFPKTIAHPMDKAATP